MKKFLGLLVFLFLSLYSCFILFPDVEVSIVNRTDETITGFYAKAEGSQAWGETLIDAAIPSESSASVFLLRTIYDFMIELSNSDLVYVSNVDLNGIDLYDLVIAGDE